jgi:DNA-binding transcriptional ArsR family regulator
MPSGEGCKIAGEMAGVFKALGDFNRLRIIYYLATDTSGNLNVGDLAKLLGITQPAVSQHIRTLKGVRIVESRKEGYHVYFTFNRERMLHYRENFDVLFRSVMEKCDQESIRKTKRSKP